jgi:anionic cell wall polymer biosynthesis LytR-Cps2A-Psr (LCP) family protein
MVDIIDAVGGVMLYVSEAERVETNKFITEYTNMRGAPDQPIEEAGYQWCSGVQAMNYARIRKNGTGDDWGRIERQSKVLGAIFTKVKALSMTEMLELAPALRDSVTTSLSRTKLASLLVGAFRNGTPEIKHSRIPADGCWEYGGAQGEYIVFDTDEAAEQLYNYIYRDIEPTKETESDDENPDAETE